LPPLPYLHSYVAKLWLMSGALSTAVTLVWPLAPPNRALRSSIDSRGQAAVTVATGLGVLAGALMVGVALGGVAAAEGSFQLAAWLVVEHPAVRVPMQITEQIRRIRSTWEHTTPGTREARTCIRRPRGEDRLVHGQWAPVRVAVEDRPHGS